MNKLFKNCFISFLSVLLIFLSSGCTDIDTSSTYAIASSQDIYQAEHISAEIASSESINTSSVKTAVGAGTATAVTPAEIPPYSGNPYVVLSNNIPNFSTKELVAKGYEEYGKLDSLGRCTYAVASCGKEIMPKDGEKRESISNIKPTGWVQSQYDNISGKYLYNRCHLIGWQLSAENSNKNNLITGTKYLNVNGMLPFENMVADYIKETDNHVAYRITPIFEGSNLLASGVQMEAYSIEDEGKGICFNIYCYNVQPGITINYATGASKNTKQTESQSTSSANSASSVTNTSPASSHVTVPQNSEVGNNLVWVPVNGGTKFHTHSGCSNIKSPMQVTRETAEANGYSPCKRCY